MGTGCTVAEWFSDMFVLPRIQRFIDAHRIDMHQLSAINTAILDIPLEPNIVPTSTSSLLVPLASSQSGANRTTPKPTCHHCGCTMRVDQVHSCPACGLFIHKTKCVRAHRPLCNPLSPPIVVRNVLQDVSFMDSPAFHTPRTLSSAHIDSDPETPTSPLGSPLHLHLPQTSATILQPAQPGLAAFALALQGVQHLSPALPAPLPLHPPPPPPPPPPKGKQKTARCSEPALTQSSLELELAERALIALKEKLALTEVQLVKETQKSSILGQRVQVLEAHVNQILANQHLDTPAASTASTPPSQPAPIGSTTSTCCSNQLHSELDRISLTLSSLQATVSAILTAALAVPPPGPDEQPALEAPPPRVPQVPQPRGAPPAPPGSAILTAALAVPPPGPDEQLPPAPPGSAPPSELRPVEHLLELNPGAPPGTPPGAAPHTPPRAAPPRVLPSATPHGAVPPPTPALGLTPADQQCLEDQLADRFQLRHEPPTSSPVPLMRQRPSPFLLALRSHQSLQQHRPGACGPPRQIRLHRPGPGLLGPPPGQQHVHQLPAHPTHPAGHQPHPPAGPAHLHQALQAFAAVLQSLPRPLLNY